MKQKFHLSFIFTGCVGVLLGFVLPWYPFFPSLPANRSALEVASGLQLWLGGGFVTLNYAPAVIPAFFALLWVVPLAALAISSVSVLERVLHWKDRWLAPEISLLFLSLQGIFLGAALGIASPQAGLYICSAG